MPAKTLMTRTRPTIFLLLYPIFLSAIYPVALIGESPATAVATTTAAAATEAQARAEALFHQYKVPGLAVAVGKAGQIAFSDTFGHADLEHNVAVSKLTRFRIGSLSKLLTIAAVARLSQEGQLDLDASIHRYVPYFPKKKWQPSTRQLASHTAGIRHYVAKDPQIVLNKFLSRPSTWASVEESLSIFMDDPLVFEPGTAYAYSSYGYNLVSAVVEGASGQPFLEYMQKSVFAPLALSSTGADHRTTIIPHRTRFYYANPETGEVIHDEPVDNSYKWAGGGFLSNAEDLVRLGSAFLEPGFLTVKTLAEVFTPQPSAEDRGFQVGLGWRIDKDDGGRVIYHHGGAIAGGRAFILLVPDDDLVVVVLANSYSRFGKTEALSIAEPFF